MQFTASTQATQESQLFVCTHSDQITDETAKIIANTLTRKEIFGTAAIPFQAA